MTIDETDVKRTDGGSGATGTGGSSSGDLFAVDSGNVIPDSGDRVIPLDASCGQSTIVAVPRQVNILLVIDESGSMTDKPAGFSVDKWSALKAALSGALTSTKNSIAFGLELFPYPADPKKPILLDCGGAGPNCCEMPAAPGVNIPVGDGPAAVPAILAALDATSPGGGTPTALALGRAHDYFQSGGGKDLAGDRYVLLATDGGPNCNADLACEAATCTTNLDGQCPLAAGANCCADSFGGAEARSRCLDDTTTKTQIDALRTLGVKTFIVGIPGTEAYQASLDGFAQAGGEENPTGTPKYFSVSTSGGATGLADVLGAITRNLVTSCRLELTSDPPDQAKLNVLVDGTLVPRGADGWSLDASTSPPTVVLAGATCTKVKAEGAGRVQVVYGCKTVIR